MTQSDDRSHDNNLQSEKGQDPVERAKEGAGLDGKGPRRIGKSALSIMWEERREGGCGSDPDLGCRFRVSVWGRGSSVTSRAEAPGPKEEAARP